MRVAFSLYDRVCITSNQFSQDGAPAGSIGYIIECYEDGAFEVEVSDPATGRTVAQVVVGPEELEAVTR
jgi:hypothetical protein